MASSVYLTFNDLFDDIFGQNKNRFLHDSKPRLSSGFNFFFPTDSRMDRFSTLFDLRITEITSRTHFGIIWKNILSISSPCNTPTMSYQASQQWKKF